MSVIPIHCHTWQKAQASGAERSCREPWCLVAHSLLTPFLCPACSCALQIQLTLRAAYNAANAALCKNDNKPCLPAKYGVSFT